MDRGLSPAEAALIAACTFVAARRCGDDRDDMVAEEIARALPRCDAERPVIGRLVAAAVTWTTARRSRDHADRMLAHWGLSDAVAEVAMWQLARASERDVRAIV